MTDIKDRNDIELLVNTFYGVIRKDKELGPIFNTIIQDWGEHLTLLSDFWETNLFFVKGYKGKPHQVHIAVDQKMNHTISQEHFGIWLQHWFQTIDALFRGDKATIAKNRARNMSTALFLKIFGARKTTQIKSTGV